MRSVRSMLNISFHTMGVFKIIMILQIEKLISTKSEKSNEALNSLDIRVWSHRSISLTTNLLVSRARIIQVLYLCEIWLRVVDTQSLEI